MYIYIFNVLQLFYHLRCVGAIASLCDGTHENQEHLNFDDLICFFPSSKSVYAQGTGCKLKSTIYKNKELLLFEKELSSYLF